MKMQKWIALILSVAMVLGLAACGGRQNRGGETSSRNESQSNETETSTEPSRQEGGSSSETAMGTQEGSSAEMPAETPEASGERRWLSIIRHPGIQKRSQIILPLQWTEICSRLYPQKFIQAQTLTGRTKTAVYPESMITRMKGMSHLFPIR